MIICGEPIMSENTGLVSIIIPMYNCAPYFDETIASVMAQTFGNWEAVCVDDCSSDGSFALASSYAAKDPRIKVFKNEKNLGAAATRNAALERCTGRYIAYLDSDDVWMPEKLQMQLDFMSSKDIGVCITGYQTVEHDGTFRNEVRVPARTNYKQMLSNTLTCTHTMVIDLEKVDRSLLVMPDIRAGQDLATWLNVLKAGHDIYGLDAILAKYRQHENSISSNKKKAIKRTWHVYRDIEHLSVARSAYCFCGYAFHAFKKRLPQKQKKNSLAAEKSAQKPE